jgi:uncharacterized protein
MIAKSSFITPDPVRSKADLLNRLARYGADLRNLGVARCGIFGSFVRDAMTAESDVDLLIEYLPEQKSFDNFMALSFFLEQVLGRRVELVTRESLSPHIGPHIMREVEFATLDP